MANDGQQFVSVAEYVLGPAMDPQYVDAMEYAANPGKDFGTRITPIAYAQSLEADSQKALAAAEAIAKWHATRNALELETLTVDFQIRGHTGLYYAAKLRAGVDFVRFLRSGEPAIRAAALAGAQRATEQWDAAALYSMSEYGNARLDQHRDWSWDKVKPQVKHDAEIIANARPASPAELAAIDAASTPEGMAKLYGRLIEPARIAPRAMTPGARPAAQQPHGDAVCGIQGVSPV